MKNHWHDDRFNTPPLHHPNDRYRAWRLVAAIQCHDGDLFERVAAEARADGPESVDRLFAALAVNLYYLLRFETGGEAVDKWIAYELALGGGYEMTEGVEP